MASPSQGHVYTVDGPFSFPSTTTRRRASSSNSSADEKRPRLPSSSFSSQYHYANSDNIDYSNKHSNGNPSNDTNTNHNSDNNGNGNGNSNGIGGSSNSSSRSINRSNSNSGLSNHYLREQHHLSHDHDLQLEKKPTSHSHQHHRRSSDDQRQLQLPKLQQHQHSFLQAPLTRVNDFIRGLRSSFTGYFGTRGIDNSLQNRDPASLLEFNYRVLPLMIGCIIPVSILINVPSITSPWVGIPVYNETSQDYNDDPTVIDIPRWLNATIILALVMAVICNICVFARFLERHVWHSVILSLITATLQDLLCIGAVVPFCILYPPSKGYVYLEGFWTMIASMVFSLTATVLMSIDLHRTPQFRLQGSGVTHKQRILIAEAMLLCFYLAIGALIFIYLEHWSFLDALFFVMVTITTIGFGDRVPMTTGGRTFVIFYGAGGIVLLALAVNAIRYVILEDLHRRFAIRAKERKVKRDARRRERKEQRARQEERRQRLQEALERIQQMESTTLSSNSPDETTQSHSHYFTHLPRHFNTQHGHHLRLLSIFSRSSGQGGTATSGDGSEAKHVVGSESTLEDGTGSYHPTQGTIQRTGTENLQTILEELRLSGTGITAQDYQHALDRLNGDDATDLELLRFATMEPRHFQPVKGRSIFKRLWPFKRKEEEPAILNPTPEEQREADKRQAYEESMQEYQRRLRFSAAMFLTFWLAGAVIFTFVEKWDFGSSTYFVFIAFTTIGYGDFVPRTMAGRAIFLAYCLVGVVALTSLASLISEVLSKSMRRHVVETQLRRTERIEALEGGRDQGGDSQDGDRDLESGAMMDSSAEDGPYHDQLQELNDTVRTQNEENVTPLAPNTCHGSLENLVKISKDFDKLLQKVLGLDYLENENLSGVNSPLSPPPSNPGAIVEYLEKEEDGELVPSYLSPSISRDITSTSSIHRHTVRPMMHGRRHSLDPRGGTFHGSGSALTNDSASQIHIKAWPTTSIHSNLEPDRSNLSPSPSHPVVNSDGTIHRHNKDGTITIAALHWKHLIEYSKQFKVLTQACEEALERVSAWEVSERKLRQKRYHAWMRQKRLLNERRRRLNELGGTHGAVDDEIEDEEELEELEEWDEEGSDDDEDDEILDQRRVKIAAGLLGSRSPQKSRSRHQSRHSSRHQSRHSSRHQSRRPSAQDGEAGGGGMDPNFLHPPAPPIGLPMQLRARNPCLDDNGSGVKRSRSRSRSRERSGERPPSHHPQPHRESQQQQYRSSAHHHPQHVSRSHHSHAHVPHDHRHNHHGKAKRQHGRENGDGDDIDDCGTSTVSSGRHHQLPPLRTNKVELFPATSGSSSQEAPIAEPRIAFIAATPHPLDLSSGPGYGSFGLGQGSLRHSRSPLSHLFLPDPASPPTSPPVSQPSSP